MQVQRAIRVLVLAEACNPRWASVPLIGYNVARSLAVRPDLAVTLATQVRNSEALLSDPLAGMIPIHFIDTEFVARRINRLSHIVRGGGGLSWTTATALEWPSYIAFERCVGRQFAGDLRRGAFDLIHRVTPVSPTLGSPLAGQTDIPMLIGPLNGGLPWPREYPGLRRREREWLVPLRRLHRLLPYYRSTYQRAAGVIAGSRHTASEIPTSPRGRRYYLPENGIDPGRFPLGDERPAWGPRFRFATVGRLVPYKGIDIIIEAMAGSAALRGCELEIIGDGPERARLEEQARCAGLGEAVRFRGWLDQRALGELLGRAQAFVFPSLREFGGGAVLEAMALGLPTVVVDYGGPGELVVPDCGVRLPMVPRDRLVPALASAMERLSADPELCRRLGAAARRRVLEEFTWEAKAGKLVAIYGDVLRAAAAGTGRIQGEG